MDDVPSHAGFQTTSGTLLALLSPLQGGECAESAHSTASRRAACDEMARRYWPPVYGYLRRTGKSRDDARDLTQDFFARVVYQRELFERYDPSKGRLRAFILTALKHFVIDNQRAASVTEGRPLFAFDSETEQMLDVAVASSDVTPEEFFDRRWALDVLREAARRCEHHFRCVVGKPGHWEVFESRVMRPAAASIERQPFKIVAPAHGFAHEADAASAVQQVAKRMRLVLREVVAETTLGDDVDVEEEFGRVFEVLLVSGH